MLPFAFVSFIPLMIDFLPTFPFWSLVLLQNKCSLTCYSRYYSRIPIHKRSVIMHIMLFPSVHIVKCSVIITVIRLNVFRDHHDNYNYKIKTKHNALMRTIMPRINHSFAHIIILISFDCLNILMIICT